MSHRSYNVGGRSVINRRAKDLVEQLDLTITPESEVAEQARHAEERAGRQIKKMNLGRTPRNEIIKRHYAGMPNPYEIG